MFRQGFLIVINTAWSMLNFTIIPAGSFGTHGNITFLNFLTLGLGGIMLLKFFRYCLGGNFNDVTDKEKRTRWTNK